MNVVRVRPLVAEDLPGLQALADRQGRNLHRREYERFLGLEGARGFVVTDDAGALLGAVTAMRYFEHAFLGPVLAREGPDAVGVAVLLVQRVLEALQAGGVLHVEAVATREEAALLRPLGFEEVSRAAVLERPPSPAGLPAASVPMEPHHLLDVGALDAAAAGYGRKQYLAALRDEHPEGARVRERDGEVVGFAVVRRSRRGLHVGPVVTAEPDAGLALALVEDALALSGSWPAVALVPEGSGVREGLERAGFREVGSLVRMRAGASGEEPKATQWLLGGRITG